MPPTFGGAPKCPLCSKSVYAAEQVLAAGATWHKACFKCNVCSKWLDSSTCCDSNEPAPAPADAPAPARKPSATPKFGGAPKCPVCGKSVYAAEQMLAAGGTYHKQCFKCTECNKWLDSSTCCDSGGTLFCKACYAKAKGPKGFGIGNASVHTQ